MVDDAEIVAEAADGEEAVTVISKHSPDVVMLDVKLPKVEDFEVSGD